MYKEIEINLDTFSDIIIHRNRSEGIPSPLYVYRNWNQISKNSVIFLFTEIKVTVFQVSCTYIENEIKQQKVSDFIIHRKRSEYIPSPLYVYRKWNQISKNVVILLFTEIEVIIFQVHCMYIEIEINLEQFSDLIIHWYRSQGIPSPRMYIEIEINSAKFSDSIIHRNKSQGIPFPLYVYRKLNQISKNSLIFSFTEIVVNIFRVHCMYIEIEINLEKFSDLIIHRNRSECIPSDLYV